MSVQQVPTNGFNIPAGGPAPVPPTPPVAPPQVPPAPTQAQPPAQVQPPVYVPNGAPVQYEGQNPGYIQNPQPPANPAPVNAIAALNNPPAAPAAPAAPVDAAKPEWLQSANTFDTSTIQDPIIRSMATALQVAGKDLDLDRVLGRALASGDPSLVDVHYLAEKGGANAQQLAELAKGIVQAVEAKSATITNDIHASVGGEAQWNQATAVFNQSAPAALRITVARMMDSHDENLIKAGAGMVAEFSRNSGLIPQQGAALLNNTPAVNTVAQGLSKSQFQEELRKLDANSPEYAQLQSNLFARRSIGKRNGL